VSFDFHLSLVFDTADIELMQHHLDALFDGSLVGAIAGGEFRGRQLQMGDAHRVNLVRIA
jgi:hypothetical protein